MVGAVVVGTDGSPTARAAVAEAASLARVFDASLHLVCAYQMPSTMGAAMGSPVIGLVEWDLSARDGAEAGLEATAAPLRADGHKVTTHAIPGSPVQAILDVAAATEAPMIVVGSKGMTGKGRVLGSVPNSVAHKADCSVLIVKTC